MKDEKVKKIEEIQKELERIEKLHEDGKISDEKFAEKSARLAIESIGISQKLLAGMAQGVSSTPAGIFSPSIPALAGMPAEIPKNCPKCGAQNPAGTRFCSECGSKLT